MSRACDGAALPDEIDAPGSQEKDIDVDQISVASTGVVTTTSRTHQRRERRRHVANQRGAPADAAEPALKVMQDAAIQCDLDAPAVADAAKNELLFTVVAFGNSEKVSNLIVCNVFAFGITKNIMKICVSMSLHSEYLK